MKNWMQKIAQAPPKPMALPFRRSLPYDPSELELGAHQVDQTMDESTALSEEETFPEMEYLDEGAVGVAYKYDHPTYGNIVIKYTPDYEEAAAAGLIYKNPLPCFVNIHEEPKELTAEDGRHVWRIISEEVQVLDKVETTFVKKIQRFYHEQKAYPIMNYLWPLAYKKLYTDYKAMAECIEENGFSIDDAHGGNIGYNSEGRLVLFDLGESYSTPEKNASKIPLLQKTALFIEGEGDILIAYRDRVFLIDSEDEMDSPTIQRFITFLDDLDLTYVQGAWDLMSHLQGHRPDVLVGHLGNGVLEISSRNFNHRGGSRLLQNVVKELNIQEVRYSGMEGEHAETLLPHEIAGQIPDAMYHGTSSVHANDIMRFGLMADEGDTNYPGYRKRDPIIHEEDVFLTGDIQRAVYHAHNATQQKGGYPVVFRFVIPDKSLLVPDFDIETLATDEWETYPNIYREPRRDETVEEDPFSFSKKTEIFGYRGRIPANFIRDILVYTGDTEYPDSFDRDVWQSVTLEQLRNSLDIDRDHFYDYDPYEDEDEEKEEYNEEDDRLVAESNWLKKLAKSRTLIEEIESRGWAKEQVRKDGVEIYQKDNEFFISLGDWAEIDAEVIEKAIKYLHNNAEVSWDYEGGPGEGNWKKIL